MSDEKEFVRLLVKHQFQIYSFILMQIPHLADADDVMQDTSIAMWEMFERFEPGSNFGAWACSIARYRILKHYERQDKSPMFREQDVLDRIAQAALARSDELETRRRALNLCVRKLAASDRSLLEKVYDPLHRTLKQVAEALNRPANTVYKAVSRIHRNLHQCVQRTLNTGSVDSHG
jgi:RNA polymerase sigma-70 factor, ECF subfamily